jgi:hypothetical protein
VEIFFAGFIFEPGARSVHGDFSAMKKRVKGPYDRSGLYDENEEFSFERIGEAEFLSGTQWLSPS